MSFIREIWATKSWRNICSRSYISERVKITTLDCFCHSNYFTIILCSVQSCPTLCDPLDCSMPGFSITNFQSLLKLMSIELVMPSNHLCCPLLLLLSVFPSIRVFSNESVLHISWPKDWSFSFSISPSKEYKGLISFMIDWLDLLANKGLSRVFSNTTVRKHQFFSTQLSLWLNSHIHTWLLEKP